MKREQLVDSLNKYGVSFEQSKVDLLFSFMDKTLKTNELFNLTAITNEEEFVEKMIFDSSLILANYSLSNKKGIDIGTGAGYPGMVLKILDPTIDMTLLDSTKKKIDYLNEFALANGIQIDSFSARAEEYSRQHIEEYDFATARAVASLPILLEIITPLLKVGGELIALKGPGYEVEIDKSKKALKKLNMEIVKVDTFELPYYRERRAIIHIKKNGPTNKKYPREYSDIKRQPL